MANKTVKCKSCDAEIAASAKVCPKCGAKNKKPIYKKWWFYAIIAIIIIGALASSGGDKSASSNSAKPAENTDETVKDDAAKTEEPEAEPSEEPAIEYAQYNVTELFDALKANAMKAQDTFKGQYVEITGFLGTIDSSGKYIGVGAGEDNYDYLFQDVQCFIKNDEQKSIIMEMNSNDPITVRGEITDVGEVLGYTLDIDSIG